jgi:hypothetical protein
MEKSLSYLAYVPPKSNSHGHAVRDKDILRAINRLSTAVNNSFGIESWRKPNMTVSYYKQNVEQLAKATKTLERLIPIFGKPSRTHDNKDFPDYPCSCTWQTLNITMIDVTKQVLELLDNDTLPIKNFWFSSSIKYKFENGPKDFTPFTSIMCSVEQGRLFVRIPITFPIPTDDAGLFELVSQFNKDLPFKLNIKHFRLITRKKNKFVSGKLDAETERHLSKVL